MNTAKTTKLTEALSPEASRLQILRLPAVTSKTGLSRSAIYERLKAGSFPSPVQLGPRAVGFLEHEIDRWLNELTSRRA